MKSKRHLLALQNPGVFMNSVPQARKMINCTFQYIAVYVRVNALQHFLSQTISQLLLCYFKSLAIYFMFQSFSLWTAKAKAKCLKLLGKRCIFYLESITIIKLHRRASLYLKKQECVLNLLPAMLPEDHLLKQFLIQYMVCIPSVDVFI